MSEENKVVVVAEQLTSVTRLAQFNHVEVATSLKNAIKNGEVDPLTIHMFLKRTEKLSEIVKKDEEVREAIVNAACLHSPDKTFDFLGASLKVGAVHTAYDFSVCGDLVWNNLNDLFNTIKELKTEREKTLKAAFPENPKFGFSAPRMVVDKLLYLAEADCGEEIVLNQPKKIVQEGVRVTFKK